MAELLVSGNNLSGFAFQFATQNIHSRDANLAPSAKNCDTFLRTRTCPGGSTGGRQLDYAHSLFSGGMSCTPSRLRGFVCVLKIGQKRLIS